MILCLSCCFPRTNDRSYRWSVCSASVFSVAQIWAVVTVKPLKIHLLLSHSVFLVTSCVSSVSYCVFLAWGRWACERFIRSSRACDTSIACSRFHTGQFLQKKDLHLSVSVSEHTKTSAREDMNDCCVEERCVDQTHNYTCWMIKQTQTP